MATEMTGIFSQQDKERLETTYQYRKKILEEAFKDGDIPTNPKEIEAINNVLSSMDKAIYDKAQADLKYRDSQNKEATLTMVAESLRAIQENKAKVNDKPLITDIGEDHIPLDIVKGELEIGIDQIGLNEILGDEEEENGN